MAILDNHEVHYAFADGAPVETGWTDADGGHDLTYAGGSRMAGPCDGSYSVSLDCGALDGATSDASVFALGSQDWVFTFWFKGDAANTSDGPILNKGEDFPAPLDYYVFYYSGAGSRILRFGVRAADDSETGE